MVRPTRPFPPPPDHAYDELRLEDRGRDFDHCAVCHAWIIVGNSFCAKHRKNFKLRPLADTEVYKQLLADDRWSAAYFGMAMMLVWAVTLVTWSILFQEQFPNV